MPLVPGGRVRFLGVLEYDKVGFFWIWASVYWACALDSTHFSCEGGLRDVCSESGYFVWLSMVLLGEAHIFHVKVESGS